jgi:hypothetical protein
MTLVSRESDLHSEFFGLRLFGKTQQSDFKSRKRTYVGLLTLVLFNSECSRDVLCLFDECQWRGPEAIKDSQTR